MSLRKTRLVPAEPKVGRYRLFDWLPKGWRRCRACGERIRLDHAEAHMDLEIDRHDSDSHDVAMHIRFLLRARRSRRNRAHAQYQYATKGEPWRKRKPRPDQMEYVPAGEEP